MITTLSRKKVFYFIIGLTMKTKNGILSPIFPELIAKDSKNTFKALCDAGMLVIYQNNFLKNKNKKTQYVPCILPLGDSVDIDDIEDFKLAEKLFKKK